MAIMLSVVIPALNEEKLLPDCLASLQAQDYDGRSEVIVVDNGSTDSTASVARSFGARVVPCPEKRNAFYAREKGASAAKGDIIIQADADTVYPKGWLSRIASQFAAHPEAAAVAGRYTYRDPPRWAKIEYHARNIANHLSRWLFGWPVVVSGATFAFRRESFLKAGGYQGLTYSPDQYGISARLSRVGKVIYDPKLVVATSARTVQDKSFARILADLSVHLKIWFSFMGRFGLSMTLSRRPKRRLGRVATASLSVGLAIVAVAAYGYFVPASPVFGKVYTRAVSTSNVVALTFDDGPNEPYTSQILDILARYDVKATLFLIGKNVMVFPDTAKRTLIEGHVIGNHSYTHNANHALTTYGARDLSQAQDVISGVLGVSPHLYRPPHGKKTPWELHHVREDGLVEVGWSIAVNELGGKPPEELAKEIIGKTKPGGIILLHDGYGTEHDTPRANKSVTGAAVPLIIEGLQAKGFQFVTVPELLNMPAYNR